MLPDGGFVGGIRAFFCARKLGFYAIDGRYGDIVFRNRQFRNRENLGGFGIRIGGKRIFVFLRRLLWGVRPVLDDVVRPGNGRLRAIFRRQRVRTALAISRFRRLAQHLLHLAQIQPGERGGSVRGFERRQLVQRTQPQIVKELARSAEQRGTTRRVAVANDFDPAAVLEGLHDLRRNRHAADIFDVAARHGLAPGDDGKRFHHGARILGRLFRAEALKVALHAGAALETPAGGELYKLQPAVGPVALQGLQKPAHRAAVELFIIPEQLAHIGNLHRLNRAQQRGFQHEYCLAIVHRHPNSKMG